MCFSLEFFDHALGSWNARFTELQFLDFSTVPTASLSSSSCETDQNAFRVSVKAIKYLQFWSTPYISSCFINIITFHIYFKQPWNTEFCLPLMPLAAPASFWRRHEDLLQHRYPRRLERKRMDNQRTAQRKGIFKKR